MKPEEIQAIAAIAQVVLTLVTLFLVYYGTVRIAKSQYHGTVRIAKSQYLRTVFDAWMALDTCLLNDPELLEVFESIDRPGRPSGQPEDARKRIVAFMILNPLSSFYYGIKNGYIEKESLRKVETNLRRFLKDEEIYRMTQDEVFGESFAHFCKEIKSNLLKTAEPHAVPDPAT